MSKNSFAQNIQQTLTGGKDVDSVLEPVVRLCRGTFGENFVFMQNNAPPHTSRIAQEYLEPQRVVVLDWPVRSLDLNFVENLWNGSKEELELGILQEMLGRSFKLALVK